MASSWTKIENEEGYPNYCNNLCKLEQNDHPQFQSTIMDFINKYNQVKYSTYRTAFKIYSLQNKLEVPPLWICTGVLDKHNLSLCCSSLALEVVDLEAVISDIYFAAEKEGYFYGNIDTAIDLLLNLLLNVYDRERKHPIQVLAAKAVLILLSKQSTVDKWIALANCVADHNRCVSPYRLRTLLSHAAALLSYLSEQDSEEYIQRDINECFSKSSGMLGAKASEVAEWGVRKCLTTRWLSVLNRIQVSRNRLTTDVSCLQCGQNMSQVLRFKCAKCIDFHLCEDCYLYDSNLHINLYIGHEKSHLVQEIIDGQIPQPQRHGFMHGVKKFFCTKKRKRSTKKRCRKVQEVVEERPEDCGTLRRRKDGKAAIVTSTIGKASGHSAKSPCAMLQDIINEVETQFNDWKELLGQTNLLDLGTRRDEDRKQKLDTIFQKIAAQISRLKTLKKILEGNNIQDFDVFSPILKDNKTSKVSEDMKNYTRVLSLDSRNASVTSNIKKTEGQHLMTISGDAYKPIVFPADTISTVSMNDISFWYNDTSSCTQTSAGATESLCDVQARDKADMPPEANDKLKENNSDFHTVINYIREILCSDLDKIIFGTSIDQSQLREDAEEIKSLVRLMVSSMEQANQLRSKE